MFWTLTEFCADFQLPFDLMIGVNRGVYEAGVHQGRDLYDSRVSLIQYRELFNAFPQVKFPVSVLASVTNQELVSYAWIFPNVLTSGHWWYSNTPAYIEHDLAARLEAVPQTKQIGYYSDMYKLEFGLPKFRMYKRILAKVLAERFVIDRGWTEERAVALGRQVLRTNVERIFDRPGLGVPLGTAAEAALAAATAGPVMAGAAAETAASPDARSAAGEDVRMPEEPSAEAGGPPLPAGPDEGLPLPADDLHEPEQTGTGAAGQPHNPLGFLGPAFQSDEPLAPDELDDLESHDPLDDLKGPRLRGDRQ